MNKFTWIDIMESGDYVLTHAEYAKYPCYCETAYWKKGEDMDDYISWGTCQVLSEYQVDNQNCNKKENEENKIYMLKMFYKDIEKWQHNIHIKIVNVFKSGHHMYMVDFKAHEGREDGYEIGFGYVHKDDYEAYLVRRDNW